jgi:hypothetical protein
MLLLCMMRMLFCNLMLIRYLYFIYFLVVAVVAVYDFAVTFADHDTAVAVVVVTCHKFLLRTYYNC